MCPDLPSIGVPIAKTHVVPGHQRLTINLAAEDPALASAAVSTVAATSRFNIAVTGAGSDVAELIDESFGTVIESAQPVIVERALYLDAGGVTWAAGTSATATRLP